MWTHMPRCCWKHRHNNQQTAIPCQVNKCNTFLYVCACICVYLYIYISLYACFNSVDLQTFACHTAIYTVYAYLPQIICFCSCAWMQWKVWNLLMNCVNAFVASLITALRQLGAIINVCLRFHLIYYRGLYAIEPLMCYPIHLCMYLLTCVCVCNHIWNFIFNIFIDAWLTYWSYILFHFIYFKPELDCARLKIYLHH